MLDQKDLRLVLIATLVLGAFVGSSLCVLVAVIIAL